MTYLPTDADLALLNNHSSNIYCRIDMLNKDFITIDSLEGLVIDGSISIDSESDVRRTFNVTLYLGKKSGISSLTEEDWISKNVRVFIGLSGRGMSKISASKSIDEMIRENADYQLATTNYDDLIQDITNRGYAKYGNIDNLNRDEPISQSIIRSLTRSMTAHHRMIQLKQRNGTPNLVITLRFWEVMIQFVKMALISHLHQCCRPKTDLCRL